LKSEKLEQVYQLANSGHGSSNKGQGQQRNQVVDKSIFEVSGRNSREIPDWLRLAILIELRREVGKHINNELCLQHKLQSSATIVSKCCKPHVNIGLQQARSDVDWFEHHQKHRVT